MAESPIKLRTIKIKAMWKRKEGDFVLFTKKIDRIMKEMMDAALNGKKDLVQVNKTDLIDLLDFFEMLGKVNQMSIKLNKQ